MATDPANKGELHTKLDKGRLTAEPLRMNLVALVERFPDEQAAKRWLEQQRWSEGKRRCFHCGVVGCVHDMPNANPIPYHGGTCKKYLSLRTGSVMRHRKLSLRIWTIAICLLLGHPNGLSSVQLAKLLGISQKSAGFRGHRIRKAFATPDDPWKPTKPTWAAR